MKKRRVTLSLDEDVVAALDSSAARSMSAAANEILRTAITESRHRAALARWLDHLDAEHGPATPAQQAAVDDILDRLDPSAGDRP